MSSTNPDGTAHAMRSMEDRQMNMGPHMKMTTLRDLKPGDQEKADQIVAAARKAAEEYTDYKVALADGYKIFLPNLPQKQYHFTNYRYAFEAAISFNPEHPTSLLYEKQGDGYKLIGVMYTAPKNSNWTELDQRIPSEHRAVARAHQYVPAAVRQEGTKLGDRMQNSDWPVLSPTGPTVTQPAESSCPRSLAGWCMCIPSSKNLKTSGPSSVRLTWTDCLPRFRKDKPVADQKIAHRARCNRNSVSH